MAVTTGPEIETPEEQDELQGQMSFLDHLEELRQRIIRMLIAVGVAFAACWAFSDQLYRIIAQPLLRNPKVTIIFTSPTQPFNLSIKVAFVAALFLSSPFILAQIWLFIAPGLYKYERRYAGPFIISSSLLFILGGVFGYFIAFPFAVDFLVNWGVDFGMTPNITAVEYLDLFLTVMVALGIVFEIPAFIFILSRIGLVSAGFLLRNTKYAVLIVFILAAIITPTSDIPNMMIIAVPMILLYLLGILVALVFGKKRRKKED